MRFEIANTSLMCSTLILGGFPQDWETTNTFEKFVKKIRHAVTHSEDEKNTIVTWSQWQDDHKEVRQCLCEEKFSAYAMIIATTLVYDDDDPENEEGYTYFETEGHLKKLGFKKNNPRPVYNEKNGSKINLWSVTVKTFLRKLKEAEEQIRKAA